MDNSSTSLSIVAPCKKRRKTVSDFFPRRQTKKKSEEEQLRILLQNLISDLSFGIDVIPGQKSPRPVVKKDTVERFVNGAHANSAPRSFSHKKFKKHRRQEQLLYFYGKDGYSQNGKRKQFLSLLLIDIDCHETGTKDGAWKLAETLKKWFPGMFIEESGGGLHGYIVVDVGADTPGSDLVAIYKELEQVLDRFGSTFDVEMVEIKGMTHRINWVSQPVPAARAGFAEIFDLPQPKDFKGEVTFGSMATLPKYMTLDELLNLPVTELAEVIEITGKLDEIAPQLPVHETEKRRASCCLDIVIDDPIRQVAASAWKLSGAGDFLSAGRRQATKEDLEIFLGILHFCFLHENTDGSLPTKRIKAIWQSLFVNGQVSRGHSDVKVKLLRDLLSGLGWIEWQDETYCLQQACKWRLSEEIVEIIEDERLALSSSTNQKTNNNIFADTAELTVELKELNRDCKPTFNAPETTFEVERRKLIEMEEAAKLIIRSVAA